MSITIKTFQFGNDTVTLETRRIARQATGAVLCTIDDAQVLSTVVDAKRTNQDFFPLSVHYQERAYAVGKIPGGFLKREGRPSEKETLTSRLIDRSIRPLFPKGFMNEIQIVCTVMSTNTNLNADLAAMLATSAALTISGIPFNGPIGSARVGFNNKFGYVLNPSYSDLNGSLLNMVVAGTKDAVLMVESEAQELTENEMLDAVLYAHKTMQVAISAITEFAEECAKPRWKWDARMTNASLVKAVESGFADQIEETYGISEKIARYAQLDVVRDTAVSALVTEEGEFSETDVINALSKLEKHIVRRRIIDGKPRIDGRDNKTVRPISVEAGLLNKTHGSALFTRGETQVIATCTLGTRRDSQITDGLTSESRDSFMLHYNFPPYSVGECGRMGGVSRREIGHGRLARNGIQAMLPSEEEFPYTIRVVSEITESNGSSSMASVCGASLSMMDAGVPLKAPVAGIAMGLIKEDDGFAILTDILGDEDHLGDMDFKVAGTSKGITALQMDIKIEGINEEIIDLALNQALEARTHILREMAKVIGYARPEVSVNAPSIATIKIDPEKIRDVIGKGGATIRAITEQTGASIDLDDDGTVRIYATDKMSSDKALLKVHEITAKAEINKLYRGKVVRLAEFGAFVNILPGKDGLVHISQIAEEHIHTVSDFLSEGQNVIVKVLDVDKRGRIKLSMKDVTKEEKANYAE